MQVGTITAPGVFAGLLQRLQDVLERMSGDRSARTARCLTKLMVEHRVARLPVLGKPPKTG